VHYEIQTPCRHNTDLEDVMEGVRQPLQPFWQLAFNTCLHKRTSLLWQNYYPPHTTDNSQKRSQFGMCTPNMQSIRTSLILRSSPEPSTRQYISPTPIQSKEKRPKFAQIRGKDSLVWEVTNLETIEFQEISNENLGVQVA
jgi:hypothetical protein